MHFFQESFLWTDIIKLAMIKIRHGFIIFLSFIARGLPDIAGGLPEADTDITRLLQTSQVRRKE